MTAAVSSLAPTNSETLRGRRAPTLCTPIVKVPAVEPAVTVAEAMLAKPARAVLMSAAVAVEASTAPSTPSTMMKYRLGVNEKFEIRASPPRPTAAQRSRAVPAHL